MNDIERYNFWHLEVKNLKLAAIIDKHEMVNKYIRADKEIPHELSKGLITFPIKDSNN